MDEYSAAHHIAAVIFLCLSSLQLVGDMLEKWHKYIRSLRQNRRGKRK